jgi:hypothetical protein
MFRSDEYAAIKADYDQISRAHFPRDYFQPEGMSFARSDAICPTGELADMLAREYEQQCRMHCYGSFPSWEDIQRRFAEIPSML